MSSDDTQTDGIATKNGGDDGLFTSRYCVGTLEAVDLQLVGLGQAALRQPLADVFSLVALQLKHLSVFWVLDHCSIAGKFLQTIQIH